MADTTLFDDGDVQPVPDSYEMSRPCRWCQHTHGTIRPSGGQNCVYCNNCGKHAYNASKAETGEAVRSTSSRPEIKAALRARILERDNYRCFLCGKTAQEAYLQISHLISVRDGRKLGMTDEEIWSYFNLAAWCEECNLGQSGRSVNPMLQFRAFTIWNAGPYPQ